MAEQRRQALRDERGMVTSEFAVGTIGACALASVLIALSSGFEPFFLDILELAISPIRWGLMW